MRHIAAAVFILALVLALGIGALYYQSTVTENQRRFERCLDSKSDKLGAYWGYKAAQECRERYL